MHDAFLHLSASGHLCPFLMGTLMRRYLHHICSCSLSWRLSQKPLKSKFLSICHWQVFKMILRADTFSFRLYWTFPYFFNAAFLKPSIYAEWWWKFKSFHQVQGSTHCKRWAKQYFYFNPNECDIQIYRRKNPLNELINLTLPIILHSNG